MDMIDGVKILYCPICDGVRLRATRFAKVRPPSIFHMADICAWYLSKQEGEERSYHFLMHKATWHYGMNYHTAKRALNWLIKAGKGRVGYYQVSIDGVVADKNGSVALEHDERRDPPLLRHELTCWRCGYGISLDDVEEGSEFSCPRCKKLYKMLPGDFVRAK